MPCTSPLKGYKALKPNPSGKYPIVFNSRYGHVDMPLDVPCSQCMSCRLERVRQWSIRMYHEGKMYDENCFITLTYDNPNLPSDYSLNKRHFQLFMKRLRKHYTGKKIRFYHCGEYGDESRRPHYHAILFNHNFSDRIPAHQTSKGNTQDTSEILTKLWGKGFATIGPFTPDTAAYCAGYITKKITGERAESHYQIIHPISGEIHQLKPEYATMSNRPGIGFAWYSKYKTHTYDHDYIVIKGKKMKPPKYYDSQMEKTNPEILIHNKSQRIKKAKSLPDNKLDPADRLHVIDFCKKAKYNQIREPK